ncbi:hypothetical protein ROZALSC1DRAFT_24054 [Rozella allomycis CSF55]|uniref:Uncharacterized protein n=1 Tax=Rozella allomycis (strain CSF55) TaxID=988480 RepID=A0A4P9YDY6_ROZAC|nr:hypothetical protein ROZALSC1DRAFT_24054 [Rozella allomycis CSF55]
MNLRSNKVPFVSFVKLEIQSFSIKNENLLALDLSNNDLEALNLTSLYSLLQLNAAYNKISEIQIPFYLNLLKLKGNNLKKFNVCNFSLTRVNMDGNKIRQMDCFLPNLKFISLADNLIDTIDNISGLIASHKLECLILNRNPIMVKDDSFIILSSLFPKLKILNNQNPVKSNVLSFHCVKYFQKALTIVQQFNNKSQTFKELSFDILDATESKLINEVSHNQMNDVDKSISSLTNVINICKSLDKQEFIALDTIEYLKNEIMKLAAIRLQCWYRAEPLVIFIQQRWKFILKKRYFHILEKQHKAASKIQAFFRGRRARKIISKIKIDYTLDDENIDWIKELDSTIAADITNLNVPLDTLNKDTREIKNQKYKSLSEINDYLKSLPDVPVSSHSITANQKNIQSIVNDINPPVEDEWHFENKEVLLSMQKKRERMTKITEKSKLRDIMKDPINRLKKFHKVVHSEKLPPIARNGSITTRRNSVNSTNNSPTKQLIEGNPAAKSNERKPIKLFNFFL